MKKRVLFLYSNRPEPLPVRVMRLLNTTGEYQTELLYLDRRKSSINLPLSGLVDRKHSTHVTWATGDHPVSKVVNRLIVVGLFVRRIRATEPDVIHAWSFDMLLAASIAAWNPRRRKVVFTLQDTAGWMLRPAGRVLQQWVYRGVDQFFVTSRAFDARFLRRFRLVDAEREIVFLPNVPPADQFADFEPSEARACLTIGYIGLFRGREGITMLCDAARMAREAGADVRLLFAGKGRERDLIERLEERNDFVDYVGPYRHDRDIRDIYGNVDVVYAIYDRSYDKKIHLAYRLCEAVNCGLPVIVGRGTHMAEIVAELGLGMSVELGDVQELARALSRLWRSSDHRKRIQSNCEKALPQFVLESYHERIVDAYARLWNGSAKVGDSDQNRPADRPAVR